MSSYTEKSGCQSKLLRGNQLMLEAMGIQNFMITYKLCSNQENKEVFELYPVAYKVYHSARNIPPNLPKFKKQRNSGSLKYPF